MSEMSTPENDELIQAIYAESMGALQAGEPISAERRLIHDVEHLMQETNSGASFEQYFRWASLDEIAHICDHLKSAGLDEAAEITREAMDVAFPVGLPATDDLKSDSTEWTEEQEEALSALFSRLEEHNGQVTNQLAAFARRTGA